MTTDRPTHPIRRTVRTGIALLAAALIAVTAGCAGDAEPPAPPATADRQAGVAERGAAVMPFDLERTTHRFAKTATGGVQTVVADDPRDTTQIDLVRRHLRDEADRFRRGDFTDPARIHGDDMPGLAALRDSAGKITIAYTSTVDGARIAYSTVDNTLVAALHAWFDAQLSDHGSHATHN